LKPALKETNMNTRNDRALNTSSQQRVTASVLATALTLTLLMSLNQLATRDVQPAAMAKATAAGGTLRA
jgi:hypothetical protein